eukprot:6179890-Pyramimonas_sp.AAC.1
MAHPMLLQTSRHPPATWFAKPMRWRWLCGLGVGWFISAAAPTLARAGSGRLVWRRRRGRGGAGRWARPSGHFTA